MATLATPPDTSPDWAVTVFPDAREGWIMRPILAPESRPSRASPVLDIRSQLDDGFEPSKARLPQNIRRARGRIRRYAVANQCSVLVTPTYAPEYVDRAMDRPMVEGDLRNLVRRARWEWGHRFPYITLPEIQPARSEVEGAPVYNGMMLVPPMPKPVFKKVIDSWPYGRGDGYNGVDVTRFRKDRGGASYASKAFGVAAARYVSKDFDQDVPPGVQLYRVGQGFQPEKVLVEFSGELDALDALEFVAEHYGASTPSIRGANDDSWVGAFGIW